MYRIPYVIDDSEILHVKVCMKGFWVLTCYLYGFAKLYLKLSTLIGKYDLSLMTERR
jgi:hypothetical protein